MLTQYFRTSFFLIVLVFNTLNAYAQTPPDAGVLQQQIERDLRTPFPAVSPKSKSVTPVEQPVVSGPTVTVTRFEFVGNTLLSTEQLDKAVAGFLNKPLSFADLQAAAAAVAEAYRAAGWVVRTFLPRQDLSGGVVRIEIVEAVFGKVRIDGPDSRQSKRVSPERINAVAMRAQPAGKPINTRAIDRALLLLDDMPGVVVTGSLGAGRSDGETDLLLQITDEPLLSGDIRADNTGSRSTGISRLTGNAAYASPTGNADLLGLNLLHTQGSDYVRMAYTLPLGYDGWTAGINASAMRYQLVGAEFAALDARGRSNTAGLEFNYPLLRSREANLMLNLGAEHKGYNNESGGAVTTNYSINVATLTFNGNLSDGLGGGGRTYATLAMTQGKLDLSGSPNFASDAQTTRTAGGFGKLRYSLSRQQAATNRLTLVANLSGQIASKNLDSSEKFYLGGASGVRAYPSSEGGGSEGQMLNLEAQIRLPWDFMAVGFYDWGHVRVNQDNSFQGASAPNSFSLKGTGGSLAWSGSQGFSARLTWARRIGDNPNPTAAGKDQDGSLVKNRFWLTAGMAF